MSPCSILIHEHHESHWGVRGLVMDVISGIWDARGMEAHAIETGAVAPWAEIVPNTPPMTIDDFLAYPEEDGWRYELVDGVLVRMVGCRPRAIRITMRLLDVLSPYVQAHALGQVTPQDAVYDFEQTGQRATGLLPDVGFYMAARESLVDQDRAYPFAPDLAVETASPKQIADFFA